MPKRLQIQSFQESARPITAPITKFGGLPVWRAEPQWPISPKQNAPMRFICQIRLETEIFEGDGQRIAYVFYTEGRDMRGNYHCGGRVGDGESAVVVQPHGIVSCQTQPLREGPSLYKMVPRTGGRLLVEQPVEYAVELQLGEDPDFASEGSRYGWSTLPPGPGWSEARNRQYTAAIQGNKIGGTPVFLQGDAFPKGEGWNLLLQLEHTPFSMNFGDAGAGFAFINTDLSHGVFLSQGG